MTVASPSIRPDVASDAELLRELASPNPRQALAEIVNRHLPLVYHAALRQTRNPAAADDVTQAVFLLLLQRAAQLKKETILAGWLYNATRFTAITAMRTERRRAANQKRYASDRPTATIPRTHDAWDDLSPLLDTGLAQLKRTDRDVVLLRFFQGMDLNEISAALGVSEGAARKRLDRAIQRLRQYFSARNIALPAATLDALLRTHGPGAAVPAKVAEALAAAPSAAAKSLARSVSLSRWPASVKIAAAVLASAAAAVLIVIAWPGRSAHEVTVVATAPATTTFPKAELITDTALANYPIAKGWPALSPGSIHCTPVAADIDGDGRPEIIVASAMPDPNEPSAHSTAVLNALLYVLHADGTPLPGWPQELTPIPANANGLPPNISSWGCSPSVAPGPDGKPRILIAGPYGGVISIFRGDGTLVKRVRGADRSCCLPIADLNSDGKLDILSSALTATIDGDPLANWQGAKRRNGYSPAVGDADGDGKPEFYYLCYTTRGTSHADLLAYDHTGKPIPGWKHIIDDASWHGPVMGDITGDSKKEIVATYGTHLFAYAADGKNLPNTTTDGELDGILVDNVSNTSSTPALADLDGDGKAEIVFFDQMSNSLRAYHGDGKGYPRADGVIATLSTTCGGVSVADLGGDGVWDFFCGTYWIKLDKSGSATVTDMLPTTHDIAWMQPTITDINNDGQADILFATPDGRVIVYETHLAIRPELLQWPTNLGGVRHTGVWPAPK